MSEGADRMVRIKAFICTLSSGAGDPSGSCEIGPHTDLVQIGLIDSFNIIEIAAFLEQEFDVRIDSAAIQYENFSSIEALAALVSRLQGAGSREQSDTLSDPAMRIESSVLVGPRLVRSADSFASLPALLVRAAVEFGARQAVFVGRNGETKTLTYSELYTRSTRLGAGVAQRLRDFGPHVVLQCDDPGEFLVGLWAVWLSGRIPVALPVAKTVGDLGRLSALAIRLGQPPIMATTRVAELIVNGAKERRLGLGPVWSFEQLEHSGADLQQLAPETGPRAAAECALVLATSGSTGAPKLVPQTHVALLDFCAAATQGNGLGSADASLNWMPIEHIGAIADFHLRSLYCGADQYHVATEWIAADPRRWFELIDRHRIAVTWAPNFAYGPAASALAGSAMRYDLSCLRFMINAGEAVLRRTMDRFIAAAAAHGLDPQAIRPTWGMSETCSGMLYGRMETAGAVAPWICPVGRPLPGSTVRIVDGGGRIVPLGETGELEVAGPSVTAGYLGEAVQPGRTGPWFRTGDLAVITGGQVVITGRSKDLIVVHGNNYSPAEIQSVVEAALGVPEAAVAVGSMPDARHDSERLAVFFDGAAMGDEGLRRVLRDIRRTVAERFGIAPHWLVPCRAQDFSRTASGKIQVSRLCERLRAGEFAPCLQRAEEAMRAHPAVAAAGPKDPGAAIPLHRSCWQVDTLSPGQSDNVQAHSSVSGVNVGACSQAMPRPIASKLAPTPSTRRCAYSGSWVVHGTDHPVALVLKQHLDRVSDANPGSPCRILWFADAWVPDNSAALSDPTTRQSMVGHALGLIRSLAAAPHGEPRQLLVVTRSALTVAGNEPRSIAGAILAAMLNSAAGEYPGATIRLLDLDGADENATTDAARVLAETTVADSGIAAWRQGVRLRPGLERIELPPNGQSASAFVGSEHPRGGAPSQNGNRLGQSVVGPALAQGRVESSPPNRSAASGDPTTNTGMLLEGGVYLVTGGTGGIGRLLIRHLRQAHSAKVIAIARRRPESATAARNLVSEQQGLPGELHVVQADIADTDVAVQAVLPLCHRLGGLSGIIHLASNYGEVRLADETAESFDAKLRAKVDGLRMIDRILAEYPEATLVAFSSAAAFLGAPSLGAYAAANRAMEAYVAGRRARGCARSHCYAWTPWAGVGLSAGRSPLVTRSQGLASLNHDSAVAVLESLLRNGTPHAIVGLDDSHPAIAPYLGDQAPAPRALATVDPGEPSNGLYLRLRAIWAEVLEIPAGSVRPDDNFFASGGHSLAAVELLARIESELGVRLPDEVLLREPTLRRLRGSISDVSPAAGKPTQGEQLPADGENVGDRL